MSCTRFSIDVLLCVLCKYTQITWKNSFKVFGVHFFKAFNKQLWSSITSHDSNSTNIILFLTVQGLTIETGQNWHTNFMVRKNHILLSKFWHKWHTNVTQIFAEFGFIVWTKSSSFPSQNISFILSAYSARDCAGSFFHHDWPQKHTFAILHVWISSVYHSFENVFLCKMMHTLLEHSPWYCRSILFVALRPCEGGMYLNSPKALRVRIEWETWSCINDSAAADRRVYSFDKVLTSNTICERILKAIRTETQTFRKFFRSFMNG